MHKTSKKFNSKWFTLFWKIVLDYLGLGLQKSKTKLLSLYLVAYRKLIMNKYKSSPEKKTDVDVFRQILAINDSKKL